MTTPENGSRERVLVTGLAVLAPTGAGREPYWQATLAGRRGIGVLSRFDVSGYPAVLAGEIRDFDVEQHLPRKLVLQTDISTQLALTVSDWAIEDAKIEPGAYADYDMGVVTANASGGFEFTHREFRKLWTSGPASVSVYESYAWFYAVNTGQISIRNLLRGPSSALVAEQAGGLDALGHARRTIRRGTPLVVSGGVDSALDPWGWVSQVAGGRVSRATDPARAYLPFGADASGYVPAEGGTIMVLESARAVGRRGAQQVYGEISGYASTFDPPPGSPRPPGLARAAVAAVTDAGLTPADIDVVFADGAGVPDLDAAEARALTEVFGAGRVPVTAPKGWIGRLYSGGGPTDVACALLAVRDGVVPPTPAVDGPVAAYGLDLVTEARPQRVDHALVLARGKGGFNSAVVVSRAPDHLRTTDPKEN